jgi:hypothetical protein
MQFNAQAALSPPQQSAQAVFEYLIPARQFGPNGGRPDYKVDLSHRRASSVVAELGSKYGIAANRLDAFGWHVFSGRIQRGGRLPSEEPPSRTGAVVIAGLFSL